MEVAPHAAEFSGAPLLPLIAPVDEIHELAGENPTALVLADPSVIRGTDFPWVLQTLTAGGIRFGLLFVMAAEQGRAMCEKVLRSRPLPRSGDAIVLVHTKDGVDALSPVVRSQLPSNFAASPHDVIVFSGHSGPLDACAGTEAILCARHDANGYRGSGVYPCYHDGFCFRQPQLGRSENNPAETVAPSAIDASVVVIAGCRSVTLGHSVFSTAHGLAHLLLLGSPVAVIVSCGVTFKVPELDLLCLSWITSGVPLGQVVHRLNTVSCETLGDCGGLPARVGPFVLFGNPCLRFESESPPEAQAATVLPAELELPSELRHRSITLAVDDARSPLSLDVEEPVPLRSFFDEDRSTLHLWKGDGGPVRVRIQASPADPYRHHRMPIQRAARNVPLWMSYLRQYVQAAVEAGRPDDLFARTLASLPSWTIWSGHAYKRLLPQRGMPLSHRDCQEAIENEVRPNMTRWNSDLGRSLMHAVAAYRSLPMEHWPQQFLPVGNSFRDRTCSCGEADRWGRRFRHPALDLERVMYQCNHCGPVGENDGTMLVGFDHIALAPGRIIEVACTVSAPADEHLYVYLGAVLDCRAARDSIAGDAMQLEIPPGQSRTIETSIPVDPEISPGVYAVWVAAAVNGVLCAESRLVELPPISREADGSSRDAPAGRRLQ